MKDLKSSVIIMLMMLCTVAASAENKDKQRMSREQMTEIQAKHIAGELALDDKTSSKFIETYTKYKKELWSIAPKRNKEDKKHNDTEEEAGQRMRQRFEQNQKVLDIRTKYYKEFSKFLTQKQIEKMYDREKKIMKRLKERHEGKKPGMRPRRDK